jgi:hypothetical protein
VHFPLLIPGVNDINNGIKLKAEICYMYIIGIYCIMYGVVVSLKLHTCFTYHRAER